MGIRERCILVVVRQETDDAVNTATVAEFSRGDRVPRVRRTLRPRRGRQESARSFPLDGRVQGCGAQIVQLALPTFVHDTCGVPQPVRLRRALRYQGVGRRVERKDQPPTVNERTVHLVYEGR